MEAIESGTNYRIAGAVNALYWAQALHSIGRNASSPRVQQATREAQAAYERLDDLWDRKRRLLLEMFVFNSNLDVRRSIVPALEVDPPAYPEGYRPLLAKAIEIARASDDEYVRHRIEVQLGTSKLFPPQPHRTKSSGDPQ